MVRPLIGLSLTFAAIMATSGRSAIAQTTGTDAAPTTVTVTAKPSAVVKKIDRTVYDIKDRPQAATGSVADVLGTLPSVSVDTDGNVSLRGSSVQVLVDGKPVAALKGANRGATLQSMPANGISKVEVIPNPGAEFRTDSGAVINIITKTTHAAGASGDINASQGSDGRYLATLSGAYALGRFKFTGSLGLYSDGRNSLSHTDRTQKDTSGQLISLMGQDYSRSGLFDTKSLDLGATYTATDADSFSLSTRVSARHARIRIKDHTRLYDAANVLNSDETTLSAGPQGQYTGSVAGTYKHKGKRDGETFTLTARHEEVDPFSHRFYSEHFIFPAVSDTAYRIQRNTRQMTDDISGDYVLPLGPDKQLTTGFDFESDHTQSRNYFAYIASGTGLETIDASQTNAFLIEQNLSAGYVTYQAPVGKWLIQGGLRVENMLTRQHQTRVSPYLVHSDLQWAPSFYATRELSDKTKVKFTYAHRIERPTASDLNPLATNTGSQDIFIGNPNLKPGQVQSYELGYEYTTQPLNYSAALYYHRADHIITDYSYFENATLLIGTRANAGRGQSGGLDMSLDQKLNPKISYSLSADIYYNELDSRINGVFSHHSGTTYTSKASFDYKPKAGVTYEVSAQSYGPTLTAQGRNGGYTFASLSYSRKLSERLKLTIAAYNVTNTLRLDNLVETSTLRDHTVVRLGGTQAFVSLSYKMGGEKPGG